LQYNGRIQEEILKIRMEGDIPNITSELKSYFNAWKANPKGRDAWVDARIGFDGDEATMLEDLLSLLGEDKHVFWVALLQKPFTKEEHMLKQSQLSMNMKDTADFIAALMQEISEGEGRPKDIPFALKSRKIVDGKSGNKNGDDDKTTDCKNVPKAVYVMFPWDKIKEGTQLFA